MRGQKLGLVELGTVGKSRNKIKNARPQPLESSASASRKVSDVRLRILICLFLALVTLVAYWQVFGCEFTGHDDTSYVTKNPFIGRGLGLSGLIWAFTTFHSANWHPLTWISHMADYQIYGLNPGGHHLTNLLFHIVNAVLLFLVLTRMTGAVWRSAFVAALFAVHPLHVESVAWVAERKDLLSTFFWFITIYAYVLYTQRPSLLRYVPVMIAFCLGLMCKPMLVSLPFVLLLLDYWPLKRTNLKWHLVREKAPLLLMSLASSIVTVVAQRSAGAVQDLASVPFGQRVGNAAVSYVAYIVKMVWPRDLAVFYPLHAGMPPVWQALGAAVLLTAVTVVAVRCARNRPYVAVGWLWYLITLLPVIGLLQVGSQAMADRYTYVTLTGLFIIVAWGIPDLISKRWMILRPLLAPSAAVMIGILAVLTWFQVGVWQDSYSLFDHAISVTSNNYIAYNNRGGALLLQGKREEALEDFSKAVELEPGFAEAQANLGPALIQRGQIPEGIEHSLIAIRLGCDSASLRCHIALGYATMGQWGPAEEHCRMALKLAPAWAAPHDLLGTILGSLGKLDDAILHFQKAIDLAPDAAEPHGNLAMAYFQKRDYKAAWNETHIFESKGGHPAPQFIAGLSKRMPDPAGLD